MSYDKGYMDRLIANIGQDDLESFHKGMAEAIMTESLSACTSKFISDYVRIDRKCVPLG